MLRRPENNKQVLKRVHKEMIARDQRKAAKESPSKRVDGKPEEESPGDTVNSSGGESDDDPVCVALWSMRSRIYMRAYYSIDPRIQ